MAKSAISPIWPRRCSRSSEAERLGAAPRRSSGAGFGVGQGRIVDVSGKCPGFATFPSFREGVVNRNATLTKAIREGDAEIARRTGST
jgi:hypothetical protein